MKDANMCINICIYDTFPQITGFKTWMIKSISNIGPTYWSTEYHLHWLRKMIFQTFLIGLKLSSTRHLSRCATSQFSPTAVAMEVDRWTRLLWGSQWWAMGRGAAAATNNNHQTDTPRCNKWQGDTWGKNDFSRDENHQIYSPCKYNMEGGASMTSFFWEGECGRFTLFTIHFWLEKIGHVNFDPDHGWFYSIYPKKSSNPTHYFKAIFTKDIS